MSEERGLRKTRIGVVVSDKMDKTCVIKIQDRVRHPLYGKIVNHTTFRFPETGAAGTLPYTLAGALLFAAKYSLHCLSACSWETISLIGPFAPGLRIRR